VSRRPRDETVVLLTCEHASAAIPRELGTLGLPAAVRRSHRAFDVGALPVAQALADRFGWPLHVGEWSRLVADLNRSPDHPGVVARRVDGREVPGNQLDERQLAERLRTYWRPYREAVQRAGAAMLRQSRRLVHLSVHSFVERLGGVERENDFGLLCDPRRRHEITFCERLQAALKRRGVTVRRNFPYYGHTDGFTSHLRQRQPASRYLGIEIELNQRRVRTAAGQRRCAEALGDALDEVLHGVPA
jgi:predicted N-formylglutamate amidohydrolase